MRILDAVNLKDLPGYSPVILKIRGFLQQTKFATHGQHFLHHSQYPPLHMSLRREPRPQRSLLVILPSPNLFLSPLLTHVFFPLSQYSAHIVMLQSRPHRALAPPPYLNYHPLYLRPHPPLPQLHTHSTVPPNRESANALSNAVLTILVEQLSLLSL
jgi:hypothetical protein